MHIFFTGSVRGGRAHQPEYMVITEVLKKYGSVLPSYVSDESVSEYGETESSAKSIFTREREMLEKANVVVADVTTPSLGVGYLIAHASNLKKPIIALYRGENTLKLSAIIKGDPHTVVYSYLIDEDIETVLDSAFHNFQEETQG